MVNSNIGPNLTHLRDIRLQNLDDLEFDLTVCWPLQPRCWPGKKKVAAGPGRGLGLWSIQGDSLAAVIQSNAPLGNESTINT